MGDPHIEKWQAEPHTAKVLQQLRDEPSVILGRRASVIRHADSDRSVPDLDNIASFVECTTDDIYTNNNVLQNVERELTKMFEDDIERKRPNILRKSASKKKVKKNAEVKELLVRLFGSPLDDIEFKKSKPKRRHTLPVSLLISEEVLQPLKIRQKRKSEADVNLARKIQKTEHIPVSNTLDAVEYANACDLVTPPVYSDFAKVTYCEFELENAYVMEQPIFQTSVTVRNPVVIDLTKEDEQNTVLEFNGIKVEIKNDHQKGEAAKSSEKAKIPNGGRSMPLLSPVSPAMPTQAEAVLPQANSAAQMPPPPPQVQLPPSGPSPLADMLQWEKHRQMQMYADKWRACRHSHTVSWRPILPRPPHAPAPPPPPPPPAPMPPQLIRLLQPTHGPLEFQLIANCAFALKVYWHVKNLIEFRMESMKFFEATTKFFTTTHHQKINYENFKVYSNEILKIFGEIMIKDFSTIDVQGFDLSRVIQSVTAQTHQNHPSVKITAYSVCVYLHMMISAFEGQCNTPFLKKFYNGIKVLIERMDCKSKAAKKVPQKAPDKSTMTPAQRAQFDYQVQQYLRVQEWLAHQNTYRPQQNLTVEIAPRPPPTINIQRVETVVPPPNRTVPTPPRPPPVAPQIVHYQKPEMQHPPPQKVRVVDEVNLNPVEPQQSREENEVTSTIKAETKVERTEDDVIDLTWIDDGDEVEILEEIIECKAFPFKKEDFEETSVREVPSPTDSGLGSPTHLPQNDDGFKCLCGNRAIYVCACSMSMYCSNDCQVKDWSDHQKLCQKNTS